MCPAISRIGVAVTTVASGLKKVSSRRDRTGRDDVDSDDA